MGTKVLESSAWNIAHAGQDLDATFRSFDELLRPHVPYAIASWSTHDPATALFTSCTMTGTEKNPEGEAGLFRCEFSAGEPASYRSLIGGHRPAAILSEVTHGDLDHASRFRTLFGPFGFTDELRAVLWSGGTAWGSATLLRFDGRFNAGDVEAVSTIARHAADGIRLALLRGAAARPEAVAEPPGIMSRDSGTVAVIVERARPAEVSAMLVDAYGLTPRQRDVLGQILLGPPKVWSDVPPSPYGGFLE